MNQHQEKLWLLVAEKTGSNLEARFVYDELLKKLNMLNGKVIISLTETEEGIEVHVAEEAYNNYVIVGLIEKIKMDLMLKKELPVFDIRNNEQSTTKYDA